MFKKFTASAGIFKQSLREFASSRNLSFGTHSRKLYRSCDRLQDQRIDVIFARSEFYREL
jgi:hypothetical protein